MKKNHFFMFISLLIFSLFSGKNLKAQCPVIITPSPAYVCTGQTATLTATAPGATFAWDANAGSAATNTVAVTPASTMIYTVTATTGTCVATQTVLVNVITNTVVITPPVGTSTLYCTGIPYQFGAVDTTSGGYAVQYYQWYCTPSAGVSIANSSCTTCNGPTMTFSNTGTYTMTVIVNLTSGCLDSAKYSINVVQTPTVSVVPYPITVCQGGPNGTMVYVNGAGAAGTYSWTPIINVATVYAAGDSISLNPPVAGVYNYSVTGTNAAGCVSAPVAVTATVNPPPTINAYSGIYPSIAVDSICAFANTSVHMDPSYIIPGATYTWTSAANANLGTPFSNTSAVSPIYNGNVDTTFTYYGNLTVPGCPAYPTYTVYVVVVPTPTVHVASDTMYNCNKMGDTLKVTSNPANGVIYSWWPNYNISSLTGNPVYVHPLYPEYYYVTPSIVVGSNVCIGKRDSVRVLIGDTTNASINTQYLIDCKGMLDTLIAGPQRTPLNGTYQYYWTLPSVASGTTTVTGDTLVITPAALGIYTLTVVGTCVKKQTAEVLVAVNNCITPVPTYSVTTDTLCRRHCTTFKDLTETYTVRPLFYQWVFTVQQPQISITCNKPGCIIRNDTVWYEATDSSALPSVKVCYYQSSGVSPNYNGPFPAIETVSHSPTFGALTATTTSLITVYDGPLAHATKTQTINLGDAVQISGLTSSGTLAGIAGYYWSPPTALSCTNCAQPVANPSVTTQYVLTVKDKNGCIDTSNITIYVDLFCFEPFVPSAFSPNGDQENDVLYVRSNCLTNFSFKVYDRWGEKVFETSDLKYGWDGSFRGSPLNAGVFMYTLEGYQVQSAGGKEVKQKGNITLVK